MNQQTPKWVILKGKTKFSQAISEIPYSVQEEEYLYQMWGQWFEKMSLDEMINNCGYELIYAIFVIKHKLAYKIRPFRVSFVDKIRHQSVLNRIIRPFVVYIKVITVLELDNKMS